MAIGDITKIDFTTGRDPDTGVDATFIARPPRASRLSRCVSAGGGPNPRDVHQ